MHNNNNSNLWMIVYLFLGIFFALVSSHPLKTTDQQQQQHHIEPVNEEKQDRIQVDLFSQLLSTHWQFDHLDSIMSQSHKEIADHIQNHIEIDIQTSDQPSLASFELRQQDQQQQQQPLQRQQQQKIMMQRPSMMRMEHMEYDLLKSQMMNAIQARTQGLLPEMWDQAGEALGRPAIEGYVQQLLRTACPLHQEWVEMSCLDQHAMTLSSQLDAYVQNHLTAIWTLFQKDALPNLLQSTVKELEKVVDYFNDEAQDNHPRIIVHVLPWSTYNPSSIMDLSSLDDHSLFSNFITLAKI
ncbi:hypothetical protein BCR42DRAFT_427184 [Absidia repens]|uniref:Uncharacterized protein n=1 Tax=Absidia repens TaxID=90262 RepID=A0A1X2I055_9FUNG|nr:hypothetical protein BCR42DRAFT_427184 [Absidia repens]